MIPGIFLLLRIQWSLQVSDVPIVCYPQPGSTNQAPDPFCRRRFRFGYADARCRSCWLGKRKHRPRQDERAFRDIKLLCPAAPASAVDAISPKSVSFQDVLTMSHISRLYGSRTFERAVRDMMSFHLDKHKGADLPCMLWGLSVEVPAATPFPLFS